MTEPGAEEEIRGHLSHCARVRDKGRDLLETHAGADINDRTAQAEQLPGGAPAVRSGQ